MIARPPDDVVEPGRGLQQRARGAGVDVEDRRADLDRLGLGGEVAHQRGGVEAVGLGHPDGVEPGLLERRDLVGRLARVAGVHQLGRELHAADCDRTTVTVARSAGQRMPQHPRRRRRASGRTGSGRSRRAGRPVLSRTPRSTRDRVAPRVDAHDRALADAPASQTTRRVAHRTLRRGAVRDVVPEDRRAGASHRRAARASLRVGQHTARRVSRAASATGLKATRCRPGAGSRHGRASRGAVSRAALPDEEPGSTRRTPSASRSAPSRRHPEVPAPRRCRR